MSIATDEATDELRIVRDEKGRPVASDGYPISGMATAEQGAVALSISRSQVYMMMNTGELPSRRFGRARRIPWSAIRELIGAE